MRISLGCLGEPVLCNGIDEWKGSLGAIVLVHKLAAMVAPEGCARWIRLLMTPSLLHLLVADNLFKWQHRTVALDLLLVKNIKL